MSALKAEGVVSNGLVGISDDTILRMLKKQQATNDAVKIVCIDDSQSRRGRSTAR